MIKLTAAFASAIVFALSFAASAEASAPKVRKELTWLVSAHQAAADRHGLGQFVVEVVPNRVLLSAAPATRAMEPGVEVSTWDARIELAADEPLERPGCGGAPSNLSGFCS